MLFLKLKRGSQGQQFNKECTYEERKGHCLNPTPQYGDPRRTIEPDKKNTTVLSQSETSYAYDRQSGCV